MILSNPSFSKYIFVCENSRDNGLKCCAPRGNAIREQLKNEIKSRGLAHQIRVCRTGCLDACEQGPNVLIMPDNIWFKDVQGDDIPTIIQKAIKP